MSMEGLGASIVVGSAVFVATLKGKPRMLLLDDFATPGAFYERKASLSEI